MSHTLQTLSSNPETDYIAVTIVNYVAGGESVTAAEFSVPRVDAVIFAVVPAGSNSLNVPLFPILSAGKVMLFRDTAGALAEIPTTNALNAIVKALLVYQN